MAIKQDLRSTEKRQSAGADKHPQDRQSPASHSAIIDEESIASVREGAEQLRLFVEQAPVGIAMFDRDMRYLATSERWLSAYGLGGESLVGRSHYEVFLDIPKSWKKAHQRALSGETVREEQDPFPRADGSLQWRRWEMQPWRCANGSIGGILIFSEDVTARIEMERGLRESRGDLDRAQAVARTGSWRLNVNRNKLIWSAETHRIFGVSPVTPLRYESFLAAVHPDDRTYVDRSWQSALAGAPYDIEHRIIVDNEIKWVRERAGLEFDAGGKLLGGFGTVQDITDRKRAEEQLRESEERFRGIFEHAGAGIAIAALDGRFLSCNPAYSAMLDYTEDELRTLFFPDLLHPEDRERNLAEVERLLAQVVPSIEVTNRYIGKHGKPLWAHKYVSLLRDASGKPTSFIVLVIDITEQKRQEEQIKLLMGEVNHRSKNLLTLVLAIARQTVATTSDDFIDRFQERILALSVSQELLVRNRWTGVHLDKLARSQLAHFSDLIGTRIKISGPPLLVSASAAQTLGMALHELATNAGKYGALSSDAGRVEVAWGVEHGNGPGDTFLMSWRESGGPIVKAPAHNGFGSAVIAQMVEMSLNATVNLDYEPSGLVWRLRSPIGAVLEIREAHGTTFVIQPS